jgi:hypothetical protein
MTGESFCYLTQCETKEKALSCVEAEPELDGPMADELWLVIKRHVEKDDKTAIELMLTQVVHATKEGIRNRIKQHI